MFIDSPSSEAWAFFDTAVRVFLVLMIAGAASAAILIFYYGGLLAEWWLGRPPFSQSKEK